MENIQKVVRIRSSDALGEESTFCAELQQALWAKGVSWELAEKLPAAPGKAIYLIEGPFMAGDSPRAFQSAFGEIPAALAERTIATDLHRGGIWRIVKACGLAGGIQQHGNLLVGRSDVFEELYPGRSREVFTLVMTKEAFTEITSFPPLDEPRHPVDLLVDYLEGLDPKLGDCRTPSRGSDCARG